MKSKITIPLSAPFSKKKAIAKAENKDKYRQIRLKQLGLQPDVKKEKRI